jgi:hypothetical protein
MRPEHQWLQTLFGRSASVTMIYDASLVLTPQKGIGKRVLC